MNLLITDNSDIIDMDEKEDHSLRRLFSMRCSQNLLYYPVPSKPSTNPRFRRLTPQSSKYSRSGENNSEIAFQQKRKTSETASFP